ncbi:MAG: Ldh family oxidoreductase [Planctomycetes bacterium]|nr:Ldh family oxidoreductase [Planctomycetota bacterium]
MPRLHADQLLPFVTEVITRMGSRPEDARAVAEHLVEASLAGHDSHGLIRIPQYHEHARSGKVRPAAAPVVVSEGPTTVLIDGNRAWGQVVANGAVDLALAKARAHGTAAACVRNCYHVGRVGVYPLRAAREGFVATLFANGHGVARVAPWGGAEARLATNPLAMAVPARRDPVLVDITTSVVAEGKVRLAKVAGKPIPEGWVLDRDGSPSTDPVALYEGGTLLPLGGREGHKGYGLSVLVDLLGGVLSGAGCGVMTAETGNGLFLQLADPAAFGDREGFLDRVEAYIAYVRSARRRPGVDAILLPGEPERHEEARRRREGLEVDEGTWAQVLAAARELGVSAPPG